MAKKLLQSQSGCCSMNAPKKHQQKKNEIVSLRNIAEAVGVSRMTVSRAFKPDAQVKPELRERILKVAADMGYEQDHMITEVMSSFASRRQINYKETLGVVWWPERWTVSHLNHGYAAGIRRGIEKSAELHGCIVEHFVISKKMPARTLNRILTTRNIRGLIITPPQNASQAAPGLDWSEYSTVMIGTTLRYPDLHRVCSSHYNTMTQALDFLNNLGCSNPVLLLESKFQDRIRHAYKGAFLALQKNGAKRIWLRESISEQGLKAWIHQRKPDVVIADSYKWRLKLPATYAKEKFFSLNLRDDEKCSGIQENSKQLAEGAVDMVMRARIRHETGIPKQPIVMVYTAMCIRGETVKPAMK